MERAALPGRRDEIESFEPDVVVDLSAMTEADAEALDAALPDGVRLVVASSADVYRAFASTYDGTVTDALPLDEDAPLRTAPPPDAGSLPPGWAYDADRYEKLDVERLYRGLGATICRLPIVYGEHDYRRREDFVLARVRAGVDRIPFGPGTFLVSRGYAPELARGLRLAIEADVAGEVFNLAERECASVRLWAQEILAVAGSGAVLGRVPDEELPEDLGLSAEIQQDLFVDSSKAARKLGWIHAPWRECVARSVRWHLANPPVTSL
jgi:nucleoside-diphosphate-sugar epimerase